MFYLGKTSKKTKLALRFFTYGVMTIATIGITVLSMFFVLGYRFDRSNLSFEQGGLLQLQTKPPGANVTIDGRAKGYSTPGKSDLTSGRHTIELQKADYRTWSKAVPLAAGQLLWLNYIRLFPESITTGTVQEFDTLNAASLSPDGKWLVAQPKANKPNLVLIDLQNEEKPKLTNINIPNDKLSTKTGAKRTFTLLEWDQDSRYFLIRHTLGTTTEYLRLDRSQPGNALNITKAIELPISDVHFVGNDPNLLFIKNNSFLRRVDLSANTTSGALVSGIGSFRVYENGIVAFTAKRLRVPGQPSSAYKLAGIYDKGEEIPVREYPANADLIVDYSEYFGHGYLAATTSRAKTAEIIRDPAETGTLDNRVFATLQLDKPAKWLNFSGNGRMLVAQSGNSAVTYDLEVASGHQFNVSTSREVKHPFKWLDDYYLYTDAGKTVSLFEFDGTNPRQITGAAAGYDVGFSADNEHLISIGRSSVTKKYQLQLSRLVLK